MDIISIIVPVYNVEKYLERCMDSILGQTYGNLEIILVDDGSTDASSKMCDEYAKSDRRIKVIHKENGGLSDARNAGLKVATGAYIGYVDSDDWIEKDMYERMYKACIENGVGLCVCRYFSEYKNRTIAGGNGKCTVLTRDELLRAYISGDDNYVIYNSVWSKLFKRELVEGVSFPKGRNSEDIMYTTRAFCSLDKAVYIDKCLYHYVLDREGSIMNVSRGERMFNDEIPFWREHISFIRDKITDEMADMAAYYFWKRLLFYYIDFYNASAKDFASRITDEIKSDGEYIKKVYGSNFVSKGDRMRMKLFMASPTLYAHIVKLYEKFVVPMKQKN